MEKDANEFAEADRIQRETISARMKAEMLVQDAERTLTKYSGVVDQAYLDLVVRGLEAVKETMAAGGDSPDLKSKVDQLDAALLEVGRVLYSSGRTAAAD